MITGMAASNWNRNAALTAHTATTLADTHSAQMPSALTDAFIFSIPVLVFISIPFVSTATFLLQNPIGGNRTPATFFAPAQKFSELYFSFLDFLLTVLVKPFWD
jgi:hypothetical protein